MKTKIYNQTGTSKEELNIAWSPQTNTEMHQPANDSREIIRNSTAYPASKPFNLKRNTNKIIARKRKRSRHPLRELRVQNGFTLERLAQLTELSPSYLSRLESGTRRLNADTLNKLAPILSCHPGALLQMDSENQKFSSSATSQNQESYEHPSSHLTSTRFNSPDLPLYQLKVINDNTCFIDFNSPNKWINRPQDLMGVPGAISFQIDHQLSGTRYRPGDQIFAHPSRPLSSNCSILVITNQNQAFLGEFHGWAMQSEQKDALKVRLYPSVSSSSPQEQEMVHVPTELIKGVYRIIGLVEVA